MTLSRNPWGVAIVANSQGAPGTDNTPGAGADQHQPAAPAGVLDRELLRQRAAPGEAEHVDPVVTQLVEHPRKHPGQLREPGRQDADRGAADAGGVEPDDVDARIQGIDQ